LVNLVSQIWGGAFDLTGLGGMLYLGTTGLQAALHHAPLVKGRQKFFFLACPHVAVDSFGEIGPIFRPGRVKKSNACGALMAFQGELNSGKLKISLDMDDVEYSLLKQKMVDNLEYGSKPNLPDLTKIAMKVILADLERLIKKKVEIETTDYVVCVGIQVHGPHWMRRRQDMDYFWPHTIYSVIEGKKAEVKLQPLALSQEVNQNIQGLLGKIFERLDKKKEGKLQKKLVLEFAEKIVKTGALTKQKVVLSDRVLEATVNADGFLKFFNSLGVSDELFEQTLTSLVVED